jgi:hypothetical protein
VYYISAGWKKTSRDTLRHIEAPAQFLYVGLCQIALAIENLGNRAFGSEHVDQIRLAQTVRLHQMADDIARSARWKGIVLHFQVFDQQRQELDHQAFLRATIALNQQRFKGGRIALFSSSVWMTSQGWVSSLPLSHFPGRVSGREFLVLCGRENGGRSPLSLPWQAA